MKQYTGHRSEREIESVSAATIKPGYSGHVPAAHYYQATNKNPSVIQSMEWLHS